MRSWLLRTTHISWFICALSMGIILGTALCLVMPTSLFAEPLWFVVAVSLLGISLIRRPKALLILACSAGLLTGLVRGSMTAQDFAAYQPYYGKEVVLQGRVSEDVSYGARGDQRMRITSVTANNKPLSGEIWVSTTGHADIKRGDHVRLHGTLNEGFGNLQATMFRADVQELVRPHPGDVGRQFRDWFALGIARAIPDPQAKLGSGYLVGQKSALPEELEQQIRTVGLTHVVVASGYNLMILVMFARKIFARVSKYLATLASGIMIGGFMLITGLSPSMTRAGLVAGLGLLAWYWGRRMHPIVLLTFAAAVTLILRPAYIWGDIGWFLSFAAFAGILLLAPLLHSYFWGENRKPGFVRELIIATLSAQLMTLPIIMYVFGQYSPYALLANLLVLPVVPFAMLFTFIAGVGGLLFPAFAVVFGLPATVLLSYCTKVIESIANLPGAQNEVILNKGILIVSYLAVAAISVWLWRTTRHNFRSEKNAGELL